MPRPSFRSAACVLGLAAAPAVAACGGGASSNGIASQSPDAIVAASKRAAETATSVHVVAPTTFDLELIKDRGGRGTLTLNGLSYNLIRIGSTFYVKGGPAFYRRYGRAASSGKWLKGRSTTPGFASILPLTDLTTLVDKALTKQPHLKLTKGPTATIAGQQVVQLKDPSGGTLSIASTGQPYPVQIAGGGAPGETITFDRWNADVALMPPPAADVSPAKASGR